MKTMNGLNKLRGGAGLASAFSQTVRDPGEPHTVFWAFAANGVAANFLVPARVRTLMFKALGMNISSRALIRPRVIIRCSKLTVGAKSTINYGCIFDNRAGVDIGSSVGIGVGVQFLNTEHDRSDPARRSGLGRVAKITVQDGASVGSGAILLSGVTVGYGAVVAAGAVVNRDCEPHGLYAGVPARRVKELPVGS